jgi:hypothetical protein
MAAGNWVCIEWNCLWIVTSFANTLWVYMTLSSPFLQLWPVSDHFMMSAVAPKMREESLLCECKPVWTRVCGIISNTGESKSDSDITRRVWTISVKLISPWISKSRRENGSLQYSWTMCYISCRNIPSFVWEVRWTFIHSVYCTVKSKAVPQHTYGGAGGGGGCISSYYSVTTLELDGGEWSASRPGRALAPEKGPPVPIVQEAGWAPQPVWTQRLEKKSIASVADRTSIVWSSIP